MGARLKVYVSGPISNGGSRTDEASIDSWCHLAASAAQELIEKGFAVLWPHGTVWMERLTGIKNHHGVWIENDLPWVLSADAVLRIPGDSTGADAECEAARNAGIPVFRSVPELVEGLKDAGPCAQAQRLVNGTRQSDYGKPLDDFSRTAKFWEAIFGIPVSAEQVAMAMVCVKLSREINKPKPDNRTDAAGYIETLDKVVKERERRCQGSSDSPPSLSSTTFGHLSDDGTRYVERLANTHTSPPFSSAGSSRTSS